MVVVHVTVSTVDTRPRVVRANPRYRAATSALPTICNRRPFFLVVAFMATTSFEPSTSDGTGFIL